MALKYIIDVDDNSFEKEVIEKSKKIPVLVDFWAEWCGPCRFLSPILEKLAEEYNGKFILAKLDVQNNNEKAQEYEVTAIPSVKLFKSGEIIDEFIGAVPESKIREWLNKSRIKPN